MKANPTNESVKWLSRYDGLNRRGGSYPRVEFHYQPRRPAEEGGFGGGASVPRRANFNRLANEVLRADASRTFPLETAVLGVLTLASAWPIVFMIREVMRLLR